MHYTWVWWAARGSGSQPLRRIANDPLRERQRLAVRANTLATRRDANVEYHPGTIIESVETAGADKGFKVTARKAGNAVTWNVDRIVANLGYTPDTVLYRELQVQECSATQGQLKIAQALSGLRVEDGLKVSYGGPESPRNPEPNFFILGAKSFGRSSQFLLHVGFEQVRDVFTLISGKANLDLYKDVKREWGPFGRAARHQPQAQARQHVPPRWRFGLGAGCHQKQGGCGTPTRAQARRPVPPRWRFGLGCRLSPKARGLRDTNPKRKRGSTFRLAGALGWGAGCHQKQGGCGTPTRSASEAARSASLALRVGVPAVTKSKGAAGHQPEAQARQHVPPRCALGWGAGCHQKQGGCGTPTRSRKRGSTFRLAGALGWGAGCHQKQGGCGTPTRSASEAARSASLALWVGVPAVTKKRGDMQANCPIKRAAKITATSMPTIQ